MTSHSGPLVRRTRRAPRRAATLLVTVLVATLSATIAMVAVRTVLSSVRSEQVRSAGDETRLLVRDARDELIHTLEANPLGYLAEVLTNEAPRVCLTDLELDPVLPGEPWPTTCGASWSYAPVPSEQQVVVKITPPSVDAERLVAVIGARVGSASSGVRVEFVTGGRYRPSVYAAGPLTLSELVQSGASELTGMLYSSSSIGLDSVTGMTFTEVVFGAENGLSGDPVVGTARLAGTPSTGIGALRKIVPTSLPATSLVSSIDVLASQFCSVPAASLVDGHSSATCVEPGASLRTVTGGTVTVPADAVAALLLPAASGSGVDLYTSSVEPDPQLTCTLLTDEQTGAQSCDPQSTDLLAFATEQNAAGGPHPGFLSFWGAPVGTIATPTSGVIVSRLDTHLGLCGAGFTSPTGTCRTATGDPIVERLTLVVGSSAAPRDLWLSGPLRTDGGTLAALVSGQVYVPYWARPAGADLTVPVALAVVGTASTPAVIGFPTSVGPADGAGGAFVLRGTFAATRAALGLTPLFSSASLVVPGVSLSDRAPYFAAPSLDVAPVSALRLSGGDLADLFS